MNNTTKVNNFIANNLEEDNRLILFSMISTIKFHLADIHQARKCEVRASVFKWRTTACIALIAWALFYSNGRVTPLGLYLVGGGFLILLTSHIKYSEAYDDLRIRLNRLLETTLPECWGTDPESCFAIFDELKFEDLKDPTIEPKGWFLKLVTSLSGMDKDLKDYRIATEKDLDAIIAGKEVKRYLAKRFKTAYLD